MIELAVFGSAARGELRPDSDVDVLVSFRDDVRPTLFTLIDLQSELSEQFGRPVDVVTKRGLKPLVRDTVLREARVVYAA